jgi:pyrimidine deaminase RibD-like protein
MTREKEIITLSGGDNSVSYLDRQLLNAIAFLEKKWLEPEVGFVACSLIDKKKIVTATNIFVSGNKIRHAEFNAVNTFEEKYGPVSSEALLVVTLSPCVVYSGYRDGPACSRFLLEKGITKLHVGLMHEKQGGVGVYRDMGFNISFSSNSKIKKISESLLELYVTNKNLVADDLNYWLGVKRKIGLKIFK